jgi:tRNA_anti-like
MPIIFCPDCGKEMSDSAPAWPSCGKPRQKAPTEERSVGIALGIGILLLPIIFAWFTLRKGHSTRAKIISFVWLAFTFAIVAGQDRTSTGRTPSGPASTSAQVQTQPEQVMQVNIRDILSAYESNEVGADNKYKGNLIQVTGIIESIKKDILDNLYVTLGTGAEFEIPQIQAFFDDSMNDQLGQLRKGSQLTVVCRINGLMMNVLAEDCVIK